MILEFQTKQEANAALLTINQMAVSFWETQGYKISKDGKLIGKNAKTKIDQENKTKTETWDVIKVSPDGTYYFYSLTGTPYQDAMTQLATAFNYTEKHIPKEWLSNEDDK